MNKDNSHITGENEVSVTLPLFKILTLTDAEQSKHKPEAGLNRKRRQAGAALTETQPVVT